ncbi:MAG: hypothetical protein K1X64_22270 [Myxococcaceae bacterium]|nr:hypothetical protein [Myxococcaceae bacterium]
MKVRKGLGLSLLLALSLSCDGELRFMTDAGESARVDAGPPCDCSGALPRCDGAGRCVECTQHGDCGGGLCDSTSGRCVVSCSRDTMCDAAAFPRGCVDDFGPGHCAVCKEWEDCAGATPLCAYTRGVCVQCLQDADCGGATPRCNVPLGQCH